MTDERGEPSPKQKDTTPTPRSINLYLPRNKGGKGLQRVEDVWEQATVSTVLYTLWSKDPQIKGVVRGLQVANRRQEQTLVGDARRIQGKHGLPAYGTDWDSSAQPQLHTKKICLKLRQKQEQEARVRLESKTIQYLRGR